MWRIDKARTVAYLIDLIGVTGMWQKIKDAISGKKTYIVALTAIVSALVAWSQDGITTVQLAEAILGAIGLMTLRAGVEKSGPPEN